MDAFNKHALEALERFKKLDGPNKPVAEAFQRAKFSKATLRQALSNKAFAVSEYGRLESAGLLVRFLNVLIKRAKSEGLSVAAYENWLETRDTQTFDASAIDLGSVDLGDLFADEPAASAEAETETPTPDAAA
jgi:hypothetical protein